MQVQMKQNKMIDQGLGENSELADGMLDALVTGKGDCSISVNLKKHY